MGYSFRPNRLGGDIKKYWPDDNEDTIYIASDQQLSIAALLQMAQEKWPDADLNNIVLEAEYIHTDCLGYDMFDAGDWTNFIVISRVPA